MSLSEPISRRRWALLGLLVAGALVTPALLRQRSFVGSDVGTLPTVQAVRADRGAPASVNPRADVSLIAFNDYQCPACLLAYPDMTRAVAKDGKVRIVYKEWPIFGERSKRAARVALASSYQGIYPKVHHALMSGRRVDEPTLRAAVERSGGSWSQLEKDLESRRGEIDEQLARNAQQAFSLGLRGTPAFLIGPILVRGRIGEGEFSTAIRQARDAG